MSQPTAISHVTVGVADMDAALELWVHTFGFEVLARRLGPDPALESLWQLPDGAVAEQALVAAPGVEVGRLHLVSFSNPGSPVRQGARSTDLCPKNLDLLCHDLPARVQELRLAGHQFHSDWVQYEAVGHTVREIQMAGHDHTNLVLLELVGEEIAVGTRGYTGLTAMVSTVPDMEQEVEFYRQVLGLEQRKATRLDGPQIERMIGLPPGGALKVSLLGPESPLGRLELVQYEGVQGEDLYPRARPPALGTLGLAYFQTGLSELRRRAALAGVELVEHGVLPTLFGPRPVISLSSPAGLALHVYGPPADEERQLAS